jgi:hypothetical protein
VIIQGQGDLPNGCEQRATQDYQRNLFEDSCWAEIARPDTLDPIIWAAAFIWAGVVWLASSLGYLDGQAWSLFFFGAGMLVLIELGIRLLMPAHRRDLQGTLIWAAILFWLGDWDLLWPVILMAIGASILLRGYFRELELRFLT